MKVPSEGIMFGKGEALLRIEHMSKNFAVGSREVKWESAPVVLQSTMYRGVLSCISLYRSLHEIMVLNRRRTLNIYTLNHHTGGLLEKDNAF